jgi:hypothetical protein
VALKQTLLRRYEEFGRPLEGFELNDNDTVEWTRAKPNHIGFFQLQKGEIECTLTQVSQPLPVGVDYEDELWEIHNNHSLFLAELCHRSSGSIFRLAAHFGMPRTLASPPLVPCRQVAPFADGRLGAEGSGGESHGSGDALKDSRAAAQPSALQILQVGGDATVAQAAALGSYMDDVEQKCATPPRRAESLGQRSPGEGPATAAAAGRVSGRQSAAASGRASGGAFGGRSPMATPASGAASPTATPSSGARFEVDTEGVVRVARAKRKKRDMAEPAKESIAENNSRQKIADEEVADAAKESIAEDNSRQEIADKEVTDAASVKK